MLVEAVAAARRVVFTETSTIGLGGICISERSRLGRRRVLVTGSHASMGLAGMELAAVAATSVVIVC